MNSKDKLQEELLKQAPKVEGLPSRSVVLDGGDMNARPWNDPGNVLMEKAKARLEELSKDVRENVSKFNLDFDVEEIFKEIPVAVYRNETGGTVGAGAGANIFKYCRETVYQCYMLVSESGKHETVYHEDINIISKPVFYEWMNRYPEFLFLMLKAKENFRLYAWEVDPTIKTNAIKALQAAVAGKRRERWIVSSVNEKGEIISQTVTEKIQATPKWAIDIVLGLNTDRAEKQEGSQVTKLTLGE